MTLTLREITDENRQAVVALRLAPGQDRFVSSVESSLAEAAREPHGKPWFRAVYAGDEPVGFVMLSWNVNPRPPEIHGPWFLWKLLIDQQHQRRGYGSAVVRKVAQLVQAEGASELLTSYVPGDDGRPVSTSGSGSCRPASSTQTARSSCACHCPVESDDAYGARHRPRRRRADPGLQPPEVLTTHQETDLVRTGPANPVESPARRRTPRDRSLSPTAVG